jgi:hypothetical protein
MGTVTGTFTVGVYMTYDSDEFLTTAEAARHCGAHEWQVARLFVRGLLPEPARHGRNRVIRQADLPKLIEALEQAGYLPAEQGQFARAGA